MTTSKGFCQLIIQTAMNSWVPCSTIKLSNSTTQYTSQSHPWADTLALLLLVHSCTGSLVLSPPLSLPSLVNEHQSGHYQRSPQPPHQREGLSKHHHSKHSLKQRPGHFTRTNQWLSTYNPCTPNNPHTYIKSVWQVEIWDTCNYLYINMQGGLCNMLIVHFQEFMTSP